MKKWLKRVLPLVAAVAVLAGCAWADTAKRGQHAGAFSVFDK